MISEYPLEVDSAPRCPPGVGSAQSPVIGHFMGQESGLPLDTLTIASVMSQYSGSMLKQTQIILI